MRTHPNKLLTITADSTLRVFYPDGGGIMTSPVAGYGYSVVSGDSVFSAGDKDAVIYSVTVSGGVPDVEIKDYNNTNVIMKVAGTSSSFNRQDFGPYGVTVTGGFCVRVPGTADTLVTVVYRAIK